MTALAPIGPQAVHVVVDMQRLFAEDTGWLVPTIDAILPNVCRLVDHRPDRALYPRFVTPKNPEAAPGNWQAFYRRWPQVTQERMSPALFDLVAPLAMRAPAEAQIDKPAYSAFSAPAFARALARLQAGALVLSGVETDACVLATAMDAVDLGHRVIVASDAVTSTSLEAHRATLEHLYPRLAPLLDLATTSDIITAWK